MLAPSRSSSFAPPIRVECPLILLVRLICNPAAALALDGLFQEKAARLLDHPGMGRAGREPGTRELVVHENYILVYDETADLVRVLRVLHAARQWPRSDGD